MILISPYTCKGSEKAAGLKRRRKKQAITEKGAVTYLEAKEKHRHEKGFFPLLEQGEGCEPRRLGPQKRIVSRAKKGSGGREGGSGFHFQEPPGEARSHELWNLGWEDSIGDSRSSPP